MTFFEQVVTITLCALASVLTRAIPFLVFSPSKPTPVLVRYLGNALPSAIFAMLVVYCLKNTSFITGSHGIPELVGIICTVITH
ncbi:branched-chain amino acid transporter permease, partial [Schwartzia sp. (in: firmicutes)]